ncbi:hypothetical protein Pst134EB_006593 [Puccinia striiformis f. sp. tritici]|nr:hypothetical protein Pst134EB_006593 [Puccinia striiformis f. sp. tritici]
MLLDFVRLAKSHTGEYLADTICVVVEKFQIQNKICGIVTDNASNNPVMVSELKKFKGDQHWIQCYAHILNLIAQSILRPFGKVKKSSTSKAIEEDDELSSDKSEGEEAEDQICRFDNDVTHLTHSGDEDDTRNDVRLKSASESLLLNGEGDGGVASSALLYYQKTRPTKLSLASFIR